jgi:hypothetical protein
MKAITEQNESRSVMSKLVDQTLYIKSRIALAAVRILSADMQPERWTSAWGSCSTIVALRSLVSKEMLLELVGLTHKASDKLCRDDYRPHYRQWDFSDDSEMSSGRRKLYYPIRQTPVSHEGRCWIEEYHSVGLLVLQCRLQNVVPWIVN